MTCAYIHSLREQSSEVRREVLSEIQEWGRLQEEFKAVQQSVFSLLSILQNQSDPSRLRVSAYFMFWRENGKLDCAQTTEIKNDVLVFFYKLHLFSCRTTF